MVADIKRFRQEIGGKKVYVVGEFGFIPPTGIEKVLDTVIAEGVSGAMIWSMRFHNRDGGFYWHSEPASASLYNPYHYPGFPSGEGWNEAATLKVMRTKAFEIQGQQVPPQQIPSAPKLLPISSSAAISWQGSVGATSYDVERAEKQAGPWTTVGNDIDDTWVRYRPLFLGYTSKTRNQLLVSRKCKKWCGRFSHFECRWTSQRDRKVCVDELVDFSAIADRQGTLKLESANARPYKEDPHRLKGAAGDWVVYRMSEPLRSARVLTFMEGDEKEFEFYVSPDGKNFQKITSVVSRFPTEVNFYGYKLPVMYQLGSNAAKNKFLKIVFTGDAQLSRVELRYGN